MKYMLLIYGNETAWDTLHGDEHEDMLRTHATLIDELTRSGELIGYSGLTTRNARTVRVHDGMPAITDGPFSEAKEVLAGYYLIDCDSPDRPLAIAARLPEATHSLVEVRELMDNGMH